MGGRRAGKRRVVRGSRCCARGGLGACVCRWHSCSHWLVCEGQCVLGSRVSNARAGGPERCAASRAIHPRANSRRLRAPPTISPACPPPRLSPSTFSPRPRPSPAAMATSAPCASSRAAGSAPCYSWSSVLLGGIGARGGVGAGGCGRRASAPMSQPLIWLCALAHFSSRLLPLRPRRLLPGIQRGLLDVRSGARELRRLWVLHATGEPPPRPHPPTHHPPFAGSPPRF